MTSFYKIVSELYRRYPGHPTLQVMSPIRRCVRLLENCYILFANTLRNTIWMKEKLCCLSKQVASKYMH